MTATLASATPPPARDAGDHLERIPLAVLHESPLNPRQHYDPVALDELAGSLLASGQLTALIVRPRKAGGYEIAAGHRRYRAAKIARERSAKRAAYHGLDHLLAIVRDLDDRTFIETLNIENLQRDDLHPLEEAQGFRDLMEKAGYDVAKIAARIGRSMRYVYDSLTLLKLTPEARKLFLEGGFERGHAIELARLGPDWQRKALDRRINRYSPHAKGGLWEAENVEDEPGEPELRLDDKVKAVSVREFRTWINDKVRVTPGGIDPVLFPDTARELTTALKDKEKVIEITYEHVIWHEARNAKGPRVFGAQSWCSATKGRPDPGYPGKNGRLCEHSVLGVVVIGPGRGEAFHVCIAKEKCKVHWGQWQRERAKRKRRYGGSAASPRDNYAAQEARRQREEEKHAAERKRWEQARPAILKAVAEKIAATPAGPTSKLAQRVLDYCTDRRPNTGVPRGRTLEDLIRHAAFQLYADDVGDLAPGCYRHHDAVKSVKALGVHPEKIVDEVAPKRAKKTAMKPPPKRTDAG